MRALLLATGLGVVLAGGASAETLLHLTETANVGVMPEQLNATLSAQANAATPQDAQAQVNRATAAALASAGKAPEVEVSTGVYQTWRMPPPQTAWQAEQSISLRTDKAGAPALLGLLGHLQQSGLTVSELGWGLSEAQVASAREAALQKAIAGLQGRAEQAARLLHLRFAGFRSVDLAPESGPRAMPMLAMRAAAEPRAVAQKTEVSATVAAQAVLQAAP